MNLTGVVERRLLVNYRMDPSAAAGLVPAPLRVQVVNGFAVVGVCLLRLGEMRPQGLPAAIGRRSENAAHRIAVEWDTPDGTATGVYIPRRDSNSAINTLVGGRLFPGVHHRSPFAVTESADELRVAFDGARVHARVTTRLTGSELFADTAAASDFFRRGAAGYSETRGGRHLDGIEMRTDSWHVEPVEVLAAESRMFGAGGRHPATLDCALVMRTVPVTWHPIPKLTVGDRLAYGR